ncbi:hypothetical protein C477_12798, partial [Haloterrigena salina JCM 13891]
AAQGAQENATDQGADRADGELEDENESVPTVEPNEDFTQEIDSETRITDWSYQPGMFTIEIEADRPTKGSLTEASDWERGTGSFNYDEKELEEGTNTITFPVTATQGAGVAIATEKSLAQGTGSRISVGQVEQNPFRHFGGESGLFSGIGMTVGLAGVGAWYVVRSEESGVIQA